MNVLGFDTATAATSACVLRADGEAFEAGPRAGPPAHSRELMPAVTEALERSGLDWAKLDAIAVGVGPGGFTGLRIGIATARALAHASGCGLRPVSSLAALGAGIDAGAGPALPLIDAGRGELFGALYEGGEERWPPFAATPELVAERVRGAGLAPLAAGDGSIRFRGMLETAGIRTEPDASRAHLVRALHVCRLAERAPPVPPDAVLPVYLRPPDAKPRSQ